jgi:uncharacterized membrane protein
MPSAADKDRTEQRERYRELLEEVRTIMPGTQVLLAFLLTVPFAQRFSRLDDLARAMYVGVILCGALAIVLFMTPAAYHRVARSQDRAARVEIAVRLVVTGMALLALAVGGAIFVVVRFVFDDTVLGAGVGGVAVVTAALLWYVFPALNRGPRA